jgi:DNA-binding response OmpR family regulator
VRLTAPTTSQNSVATSKGYELLGRLPPKSWPRSVLRSAGDCYVIAGNASGGLIASNGSFDFAILDCNLDGESIEPVAALLRQRGIPILFVTGYGAALPQELKGHPFVEKPYKEDDLKRGIELALNRGSAGTKANWKA